MQFSWNTSYIYPNLNDQQHFILNEINEIKHYVVAEIKERDLMSKILNKYIAYFDYFDKSLFSLSVTTGSISIESFESVIDAAVGLVTASFSLSFSILIRIVKNY